jgi:hypothetical protein
MSSADSAYITLASAARLHFLLRLQPSSFLSLSPDSTHYKPVGTLQTGYLYMQTSSQDKEQGVHQRAL